MPKIIGKYEEIEFFQHEDFSELDGQVEEFLQETVRLFFEGSVERAVHRMNELAANSADSRVAPLLNYPAIHYLRYLLLERLGTDEEAKRAHEMCIAKNGSADRSINDLAIILCKATDNRLAQQTLEAAVADFPEDLAIRTNVFALAVVNDDGERAAEYASWLGPRAGRIVERLVALGDETVDVLTPFFRLLKVYLKASLRWLDEQSTAKRRNTKLVGAMAHGMVDLFAGFDAMPPLKRDAYFRFLLEIVSLYAPALRQCFDEAGRDAVGQSQAAAVFSACLDFTVHAPEAVERLAEAARQDLGILPLLGQAMAHAEHGELDREQACIEAVRERIVGEPNILFHAANNRFRAGDLDQANQLAHRALAMCGDDVLSHYSGAARTNASLLEQGIAEGLEERPLEVDPYADEAWVSDYWDYYHFEFKNFTSRQCHSVFLNRLYMDSVADILHEQTDIRCLVNIGSFCGYFDHQIALRYPDLRVIGFDRDTEAIERNREHFVAHNLEFRSDDLDDVLGQACGLGAVAVAHIRTCTLLYPAGVRALYGACWRRCRSRDRKHRVQLADRLLPRSQRFGAPSGRHVWHHGGSQLSPAAPRNRIPNEAAGFLRIPASISGALIAGAGGAHALRRRAAMRRMGARVRRCSPEEPKCGGGGGGG